MTTDFHLRNAPPSTPTPPADLKAFDLHAHSGTDLWRKPATPTKPPVESDNAPSYLTNIPASSFRAAQVTVNAQWTRLYDQGGLILYFPSSANKSAWLKTGIELYNDRANLSTVATPGSATSDWGLVPLQQGASKVTIRVEREEEDGKFGPSLWVYMLQEDGEKFAVREVTWVRIIIFFPSSSIGRILTTPRSVHAGPWRIRRRICCVRQNSICLLPPLLLHSQAFENVSGDMQVGIYACRPTRLGSAEEDKEELIVHFTDFELVRA